MLKFKNSRTTSYVPGDLVLAVPCVCDATTLTTYSFVCICVRNVCSDVMWYGSFDVGIVDFPPHKFAQFLCRTYSNEELRVIRENVATLKQQLNLLMTELELKLLQKRALELSSNTTEASENIKGLLSRALVERKKQFSPYSLERRGQVNRGWRSSWQKKRLRSRYFINRGLKEDRTGGADMNSKSQLLLMTSTDGSDSTSSSDLQTDIRCRSPLKGGTRFLIRGGSISPVILPSPNGTLELETTPKWDTEPLCEESKFIKL